MERALVERMLKLRMNENMLRRLVTLRWPQLFVIILVAPTNIERCGRMMALTLNDARDKTG